MRAKTPDQRKGDLENRLEAYLRCCRGTGREEEMRTVRAIAKALPLRQADVVQIAREDDRFDVAVGGKSTRAVGDFRIGLAEGLRCE